MSRLPGRHIDCSFAYASSDSNAPLLSALYQICQDIYRYLNADFNHIVVLYCNVSIEHIKYLKLKNYKINEINCIRAGGGCRACKNALTSSM